MVRVRAAAGICAFLLVAGCASSDAPVGGGDGDADDTGRGGGDATFTPDTISDDAADDAGGGEPDAAAPDANDDASDTGVGSDADTSVPDATGGACGDGTLDADEACDDGNTTSGDGCSAACQIEGAAICDPCVEDADCGGADDLCVTDESGSFCGVDCRFAACPEGYVCALIQEGSDVLGRQCTPTTGTCDGCTDSDGDGVCDADDLCVGGNDAIDGDGDGVPDDCDPCPADSPDDSDGDFVCESVDACPGFADDADSDGDAVPDGCDTESCADGVDNDGDLAVDCADPDCAADAACVVLVEDCTDGADNDGDLAVDCADPDCAADVACVVLVEDCTDGVDNDGDLAVDCADADCAADAACVVLVEDCTDGADNDGDLAVDCADTDCAADAACVVLVEDCTDGVDNDGDLAVDCADTDCASEPVCAPVPGESCAAPIALTELGSVRGSNVGFVNNYGASCSGASGADVVYAFTAPASGLTCVSAMGSAFDTVLSVRTTCDAQASEIACNEDANFVLQSELEATLVAGTTYYIIVDGFSLASAGDYTIELSAGPCSGLEVCDDGIDNDGDLAVDCADVDCSGDPACVIPVEVCTDGVDNDGDLAIDCADTDCASHPSCVVLVEVCGDGIDNDGDLAVDCADSDCFADPACVVVPEICTDGIDNDGDLAVDCADTDCFAAPACAGGSTGDTCATPNVVAGYGTFAGNTASFTDDYDGSCTSNSAPDVVYVFTAPASGTVCASLAGSSFDTTLYVQTACGNTGTDVGCNDDSAAGLQSEVQFAANAGQTYYVTVDGFSANSGDYTLSLFAGNCDGTVPVPGSCDLATPIGNGVYTGTTVGGVDDLDGSCTTNTAPERVFAYTATTSGAICASLAGSSFDTTMYVRTTCADSGTQLACNDDAPTGGLQSALEFTAAAGSTYFVVVDGYLSGSGSYNLEIGPCGGTPVPVVAGDTCGDAGVIVTYGTYTGSTAGFANNFDGTCGVGGGSDAIYTFVAPATGTVCVDTIGSAFDTTLGVGTSCYADDIGCNDDGGGGLQSQIQFSATAGQSYTFIVDGFSSASAGSFTLNVSAGACL